MATTPIQPQFPLTPQQLEKLHVLSERTGKPESQVLDDVLDAFVQQTPVASGNGQKAIGTLHDRLVEHGVLGCFDGPGDLNTNPRYMEGFGESKQKRNTD